MGDDDDLLNFGRGILQQEAKAVAGLATDLDRNFVRAAQAIATLPAGGRVIVSGMGKAGFVAMKFSATLASIGVSSFFLHPAEAIHGDLGRYAPTDLSVILSNSGETPEVLRMVPHLKKIGCPLLSITSKVDSNLAKHSDFTLTIGKLDEADPLGLAPTTSTTAMLALGDALALAAIKLKGFSRQDFAAFHPGGDLGRSLTLVREIMRRGDEHCIVPHDMLCREVIHRISSTKGRPGAASVIDDKGVLLGIFTDGNLRRCLDSGEPFLDQPIGKIATRKPKTIHAERLVQEALHIMTENKHDQIIVIDDQNHPVGMIDIQDLIDY